MSSNKDKNLFNMYRNIIVVAVLLSMALFLSKALATKVSFRHIDLVREVNLHEVF